MNHQWLLFDHEDDSFPNDEVQNVMKLSWLCGMGSKNHIRANT